MNQAQTSGMRNLGMIGGADGGGANAARQRTLAERLESANNLTQTQLMRMQNFIERVNGTPRAPEQKGTEKIAATTPLLGSVERAEVLSKMAVELADSLERIG